MTSVMWFRRDFRLEDNVALYNAIKNKDKILPIFHINPKQLADTPTVNQDAFFASLINFKKHLSSKGIELNVLYGDIKACFEDLKHKVPDWHDIYFNFDERGYGRKRDQDMVNYFENNLKVNAHPYLDYTLHSANEVKKPDGEAYKMFTPYFKKWITLKKPAPLEYNVDSKQFVNQNYFPQNNNKLTELIDSSSITKNMLFGTDYAKQVLNNFIANGLAEYDKQRDIPAVEGTSRLSRFLRTGEISIRMIWQAVLSQPDSDGRTTFMKELGWRDFYNMIYAIYPNQNEVSIKPEFQNVKWSNNKEQFEAWKNGLTGFPIVDAAMRQLNQTGWMHNRLRMIVASFLTKDLLIDWRWGEKYFHEHLIDYDAASNIGGWQWAASTGTDSVSYFRIFNPTLQSEKFDSKGLFIKKYVPELSNVPIEFIHEPSKNGYSDSHKLNYPKPIVNHKEARKWAIDVYTMSKNNN
ncbi:deoxyribodipyrimidine photo-lyase type I [Apilactobacillus ozensis DSM 23829 = JCM 17196]|uniref:Deoxyribodipyrimidine photo-lyase n=1 Tax=Apilactobacillus ozensis DSM 23829 = JCM 17196 TaxID=1423781 RepID=A0A0R2B258_9LACO|nr:deoxyribodipyrimidine photo-lyase [Apilactobacillus ozensis]KRM69958.1 deoxyribodipyrimidine photo-lyase type I [Apilactobacillus ozensis DSM 23829 = JCM 17196]